jgi:hypothetical protein
MGLRLALARYGLFDPGIRLKRVHEPLVGAVEPTRERPFPDAQCSGRLAIAEPEHVDGHDGVAKVGGESGDRVEDQRGLSRGVWLRRARILDAVELLRHRHRRSAALAALLAHERVAKGSKQIGEVVVMPQEPGSREHVDVGLLDEIIGAFARPGERPSGAVQTVEVVADPGRVQNTRSRGTRGRPRGALDRNDGHAVLLRGLVTTIVLPSSAWHIGQIP